MTAKGQHIIFWSNGTIRYLAYIGEFVKIHRTVY